MNNDFDNQVIFKLATIETQVKGISDNLIAVVHRLEDKISETNRAQTETITAQKVRADELEKRVKSLEEYRDKLATKVGTIVSIVAFFWLLFGKAIESRVLSIF